MIDWGSRTDTADSMAFSTYTSPTVKRQIRRPDEQFLYNGWMYTISDYGHGLEMTDGQEKYALEEGEPYYRGAEFLEKRRQSYAQTSVQRAYEKYSTLKVVADTEIRSGDLLTIDGTNLYPYYSTYGTVGIDTVVSYKTIEECSCESKPASFVKQKLNYYKALSPSKYEEYKGVYKGIKDCCLVKKLKCK